MNDRLPVLKEGDKLTGEPCIVPAYLRWCDVCQCLRRDGEGWQIKRGEGDYPVHVCPKHRKEEET